MSSPLTAWLVMAMMSACSTAIDREPLAGSPALSIPSDFAAQEVESSPLWHVCIGRLDLQKTNIGFMCAQLIHASGESAGLYGPLPEGTYAAALGAPSEGALRDISRRLTARGIEHVLVEECDEPYTGQATAIGIKPTRDKRSIDKVTSSLPRIK